MHRGFSEISEHRAGSFYANRPSEAIRRKSVLRRKIKSSEQAVSRAAMIKHPEFPGRCAWPFQLLSRPLRSSLSLSLSPHGGCCSFAATHLAACLYQGRSEQPDRRILTSSSAGCNKKKPPTERALGDEVYTGASRPSEISVRARAPYVRALAKIAAETGEPPSGQVTKLNSNIIK